MEKIIDKYGYIYKITNKVNGKIYVGKHVGNSFDETYWGTGIKLRNALKEFGKGNFEREIIEWCSTKDILRDRERYWVLRLNARDPEIGYNMKRGIVTSVEEEPKYKSGIIISVQIPKEFYKGLKNKAKEECTSVSYLIRRLIIKDINKGDI